VTELIVSSSSTWISETEMEAPLGLASEIELTEPLAELTPELLSGGLRAEAPSVASSLNCTHSLLLGDAALEFLSSDIIACIIIVIDNDALGVPLNDTHACHARFSGCSLLDHDSLTWTCIGYVC
jgi:hypothetical protein